MTSKSLSISSTLVMAVAVAGLLCLLPQPADGGGTPANGSTTDQLINQQGSGVLTEDGDYIASSSALNSAYSYWLEVPAGLAELVVEIFDADVYAGGAAEQAAERDRANGGADTSVEYRLFDPSGTEVTTEFTVGNASSPTGADNAWLVLYDGKARASFAQATTRSNAVTVTPWYGSQSTATASTDVTSLTISRPLGVSAGDLLMAVICTDGIPDPSSANSYFTYYTGGFSGTTVRLSVWYRIATASEPAGYTFTWSGGQEAAGGILRYSGVNTTSPIHTSGGSSGSSANPTTMSVTTTRDNLRMLRAYGADGNNPAPDPYPGGTTGRFNIQSSGAGPASAGAADAEQATAGPSGTAAFTMSAIETWIGATLAIRPADVDLQALILRKPSATRSGDLLIATVSTDGNPTVSAPIGWTSINQGQSPGNASTLGVWYRVAGGTEPSIYTFTWTGDHEAAGSISRYMGVNMANPIDGSSFQSDTSATPTAPSVDATNANSMVLRVFGSDGAETATVPTGTTERFNLSSSATADATTTTGADVLQAAAGATGTADFTLGGSQAWRAGTVVINEDPAASPIASGHWELRVDMSSSVTTGDDVNAFGFRAHDGDSTGSGTEINAYTDSYTITGVNNNGGDRDYDYYPYVTSGCDFDVSNFDFDSDGSMVLTSRTATYTQSVSTMSGNDEWTSDNFIGWTALATAEDYGIWNLDVNVGDNGSGNYGPLYVQSFAAAAAPPTSQPEDDTFRLYFPTDSGGAPAKPYIAQFVRYVNGSGDNPPTVGNTTRYAVSVQAVNPTGSAGDITFDGTNLVTSYVPGGSVTFYSAAAASQGTIVSEPTSPGGSGSVEWNPGTVTPGTIAVMSYQVEVTGTGSDIVVTGAPGSGDGTRASFQDHTGNSTQARATVSLGELCQVTVDADAATHTLVRSFETSATAGGVVVEWTTAAEAGTIGFDLLRYDAAAGEWVQVNSRALTGLLAPQGGTYRLLDAGVSVGDRSTYMLVEHDSAGRVTEYGPFTPEIRWDGNPDPPAGDFERVLRPKSQRLAGIKSLPAVGVKSQTNRRRGGGRRAPFEPGRALKIATREAGLYRVDAADIGAHLGFSAERALQLLEDHNLSLTHFGLPVAWRIADDGAALEFYATLVESIYTRDNIYRLEPGRGVVMETQTGTGPDAAINGGFFRDSIHYEIDRQPVVALPLDPEGDYWFWSYVRADDPDEMTTDLELLVHGVSDHATGPVDLAIGLQGGSSHDHEVEIWLNGVWIDNVLIPQLEEATVAFQSLPADVLARSVNHLEVRAVSGGFVFIDSVDLAYDRRYVAEFGRELLHRGADNSTVTIQGFYDSDIRVFDLSDVRRPVELSGILKGDGGPNGYWVAYEPTAGDIAYLALTSAAVKAPAALTSDYPSDLRSSFNAADYLIVTTRELMGAAEGFAAMRQSSGLETKVVDVSDIYDEFSDGLVDPKAIQAFLAHAYLQWTGPPRYVLLAGAGTWDCKDNQGNGGNLIPPMMVSTSETIPSIFATDAPFADVVGDDGVPELAIGRLPVVTATEFEAYTAKVAEYESSGMSSEQVLMLADNPDHGGDFPTDSDRLCGIVPAGFDMQRVYLSELDVDDARELLFEKIREGVGLVNYVGHGGLVNFAHEGLLTSDDLPLFAGAPRAPVITTFSCYIGYFAIPGYDSLGEALVLDPDGGAAAVIAPNYLSQNAQARVLNDRFFRDLFQGESAVIGDVFRSALEKTAGSVAKTTLQKYGILGDPALLLQLEPGEVDDEDAGTSGGLG